MESYVPQTDVLRALARADVFKWEEKHQKAFEALKNALSADTVLAYFDPAADHEVHVDGCPLGISATLVQRSPNEDYWRVVQYASRALSDAERRYSQIELETMAADFACRKFHVFLYGRPFIVVTDHKPLEFIFNNPRHATSIRLQRMTVRMLDNQFKIEYRPGKTNISDYTSRHPVPLEQSERRELGTTKDVRHYVNFVIENDIPKAISKEEIIVSTENDRELQKLIKCVGEKNIDLRDADLRKYSNLFNELAVVDGLVLRGERIVVPQTLREAMVKIAHERPPRDCSYKAVTPCPCVVSWYGRWSKSMSGKCLACQSTTPCHTREPLQMTELPRGPWKKVRVDFAGPLRNKDMALVFWSFESLSLRQVLLLITSFPYLRSCSTRTESLKRSKRIMGPHSMDQSLRTLLRNKDSDTERSSLGGLKLMVTWSVSCKPSRRVREPLNLKGKLFGRECKERLAATAQRPTRRQRKPLYAHVRQRATEEATGKDRTRRRNSI